MPLACTRRMLPPAPPILPLLSFPNELIFMIASNLDVRNIANLVRTSRHLRDLLSDKLYTEGHRVFNHLGDAPIHWAVRHNQPMVCWRLLQRGANINLQTSLESETALHLAVADQNVEILKMLLDCGASITAEDWCDMTPLQSAAAGGLDEIVKILWEKSKNLNICTPFVLHYAAVNGRTSTVELLLSLGADIDDIDDMDDGGRSPLHMAISRNHFDTAELLVNSGADLEIQDTFNQETALHLAAERSSESLVKLLLSRNAPITALNIIHETPLHRAVYHNRLHNAKAILTADKTNRIIHVLCHNYTIISYAFCNRAPPSFELIRLLVDAGADFNRHGPPSGHTPLYFAAAIGDVEIIRYLLSLGADLSATCNSGSTPLHSAAGSDEVDAIRLLASAGADINAVDEELQTPLYHAVERGALDAIKTLIELGADIDIRDLYGMSPLSRSCAQCEVHLNIAVVATLLAAGADVLSKDYDGVAAIHHAAREGHKDVVRLLLKRGAIATEADKAGESPLYLAEMNGRSEVVEMLRSASE